MIRIHQNALYRADFLALRCFEMAYAFCALGMFNLVDFHTHVDGFVWTLRLTNIAVDALVGDIQCHSRLTGRCRLCATARVGGTRYFFRQRSIDNGMHKVGYVPIDAGNFFYQG